jgi:hypothetical protein
MLKLYEAADRVEAQMLMDYLQSYHIQTVLLGDYLTGAVGELPANSFPVIWVVEDRDLPRARELLTYFRSERSNDDESPRRHWVCTACGETLEAEFLICWNCGKERG